MWFLLLGLLDVVAGFVIPTRIRWQSAPTFVRAMRIGLARERTGERK
jgi:hypothetical protein